jgi:hypothetical protein
MKEEYIADNKLVFNLQNIRWIRKQEKNWTGTSTHYQLVICYNVKPEPILTVEYKKEKERDAFFKRAVEKLSIEK